MTKKVKGDLKELFESYMFTCKNDRMLSDATLRGYRRAMDLFFKIMPGIELDQLHHENVTLFFSRLRERERRVGKDIIKIGIKKSTNVTYRSKLHSFFEWLFNKEYITKNPIQKGDYPRVEYDDIKFLKKEEVERVFHAVGYSIKWGSEFIRKRNMAIISILLYCGIRKGELLALRCSNIDFNRKLLFINSETSKSRRERYIPIDNAPLLNALRDYLEIRNKRNSNSPYLLLSDAKDLPLTGFGLKHIVDRIKEIMPDFHLHRFRHTFAVNIVDKGGDVVVVKQLLGHRNIKMTDKYLRRLPSKMLEKYTNLLALDNLV